MALRANLQWASQHEVPSVCLVIIRCRMGMIPICQMWYFLAQGFLAFRYTACEVTAHWFCNGMFFHRPRSGELCIWDGLGHLITKKNRFYNSSCLSWNDFSHLEFVGTNFDSCPELQFLLWLLICMMSLPLMSEYSWRFQAVCQDWCGTSSACHKC